MPYVGLFIYCEMDSDVINLKRREIGCELILITNGKSQMCFRLVPSMNCIIVVILGYATEFGRFEVNYVNVVKDRPTLSARDI